MARWLKPVSYTHLDVYKRQGKNKAGKWIFLSVFLSFVYLFFLELRNTAVLGEGISFYSYPLLQSLSLMQIGDFMGRFEVIGINGFIAFSLYKVMMLFFALCTTCLLYTSNMLPLPKVQMRLLALRIGGCPS